jgi:ABC-type Fe3+-hydroxamate transport system substrate-binding protein
LPVWVSDVFDLDSAQQMIGCIGAITGRQEQANTLCNEINCRFNSLEPSAAGLKVAYLIWRKPYMLAGKDTFIDYLLQKCGLVNVVKAERYPEINAEDLAAVAPDLIFLSSEPYPFAHRHIAEFKAILPMAKVVLVDGEMFSWYGNRLLHVPAYFEQLIKQVLEN